MSDDENKRPYTVGYGKPPREHRFQPGRSGNPRGRPRKSRNIQTLLEEELDRPIIITERGRERKIPKRQAIVKRFVASALNGDQRTIQMLLNSGRSNPQPEPIEFEAEADADFDAYVARAAEARREDPSDETEADVEESPPDDDVSS